MPRITLSIVGDCQIEIDEHRITPSAPHLFALLLLLATDAGVSRSRQELIEFLFPGDAAPHLASHSLRQLLYRVRRMGLRLKERPSGLSLLPGEVVDPLMEFERSSPEERARSSLPSLSILPSYSPLLPRPFTDWLEDTRAGFGGRIRAILYTDMAALRAAHDWHNTALVSSTLHELDPSNGEVLTTLAEALAMTGRQIEALETVDRLLRELAQDDGDALPLRRLKSRILKRGLRGGAAPLRGRTAPLLHLSDEWEKAQDGARFGVVVGPAGIGKTRLIEAFGSGIALTGAQVIHHRCDSQSHRYPLSLIAGILPALRGMRGSLGADPRHRSLLERLSSAPPAEVQQIPNGLSVEALRFEMQAAIIDLIEAVCSEQSLLLTVDDAHLLDEASRALLQALANRASSCALMILAAARPRDFLISLLQNGQGTFVHRLPPLDEASSRALFQDYASERHFPERHVNRCLSQAAGNPFYLRALAQLSLTPDSASSASFDIASLATSSYLSLNPNQRIVLEGCLLLGELATLDRVAAVSELDELTLLSALRQLEELDLVCLQEGILRGPHALLSDALRLQFPSTVLGILHKRIAQILERECTHSDYSPAVALAAAENWIAAGDAAAAVGLTLRCASAAASLGEPAAAAELINGLSRVALPRETRRELLDALVRFGEAGARHDLVASALRERALLAHELGEEAATLRRLELRIVETDLLNGAEAVAAIQPLLALARAGEGDFSLKCQATVALLVIADAHYDTELAGEAYSIVSRSRRTRDADMADDLRAQLVYHTAFGDTAHAAVLTAEILKTFPGPSIDESCRRIRRFAAFASYRMLQTENARAILELDYRFMSERAIRSEALYAASLLTEIAISEGDFDAAAHWFAQGELHLRGGQAHRLAPNSGYHSSAAVLLMMQGRYDEAEKHIPALTGDYARMRTPRYQALCTALRLRLHYMRGDMLSHSSLIDDLESLFARGGAFGHQDTVVEMLWCARILRGDLEGASRLLSSYVMSQRRETGAVEWSLRNTTSADPFWGYQASAPADISRRMFVRGLTRSAGGNSQPQKSLARS